MITQNWMSDSNFHGYPRWERDLLGADYGDYVPIFVDIVAPQDGTLSDGIIRVLETDVIYLTQVEADTLRRELRYLQDASLDSVHSLIYWPTDHQQPLPEHLQIRHIGASVGDVKTDHGGPVQSPACNVSNHPEGGPIIGIIDGDIGYLNARFRRAQRTRFLEIWMQAEFPNTPVDQGGIILNTDDIQAEIASSQSEHQIYADHAARLSAARPMVTGRRVSHGTHVLDLAANNTGTQDLPILAVQLPAEAIRATSGRRLETHVASGLRWIVTRALQAGGAPVGLVVNLSLGALGGAGDDSTFLGNWMKDEIARYDRLSNTIGKMDIVAAYGNARLERLVARGAVSAADPVQMTWRVQPDDRSDSMIELRADQVADMVLTLTAPDRTGHIWQGGWPQAGDRHLLLRDGAVVGGIYGYSDSAGQPSALIALAPTKSNDGAPRAPSGGWGIALTNGGVVDCQFSVKVQRDDTPGMYWQLGRQSSLDAPAGWIYDAEQGAYVAPAPNNPITRMGTAVSFAGVQHDHIHLVSAFRPKTGTSDAVTASSYSAEPTAADSSDKPDWSAQGDDGVMLRGIRAAGRLTGSYARLSGSSVAAPQIAAYLVQQRRNVPGPSPIVVDQIEGPQGSLRLGEQRLPRR